MTDLDKVVFNFITVDGTTLKDAVSTRVWTPTPPSKEYWKNETKGIVFHEEAPGSHVSGATHDATYVFKCYGGSMVASDARDVFRLLWDRLHNNGGSTDDGTLMRAWFATATPSTDPETGWPVHIAKFRIAVEEGS